MSAKTAKRPAKAALDPRVDQVIICSTGFGQLHQPSNLTATDLGYNPIGNTRWTSSIHDQPRDTWGVPRLRPLQLNRYERIARKERRAHLHAPLRPAPI